MTPQEVQQGISPATLYLILGIAGTMIMLLLLVVGFFMRSYMKTIHDDVKENTAECGRNKGRIELVEQKQEQDKLHLEQITQVQIQSLTQEVKTLSGNVNTMTKEMRNFLIELAKAKNGE